VVALVTIVCDINNNSGICVFHASSDGLHLTLLLSFQRSNEVVAE